MPSLFKNNNPLLLKVATTTSVFTAYSLIFLCFLFLISGIEVLLGDLNHSLETGFFNLWGWSCWEDLKFYFSILLPVYLIFLPFHILFPRTTGIVTKSIVGLFFVIQLMLVFYFNTTLLMLGSDIFGYSLEEISQTVGASGSISIIPILISVAFLAALISGYNILSPRLKIHPYLAWALPVISFFFLVSGLYASAGISALSSDFERNLVKNKSKYFYLAAYSHFNPDIYEPDIYAESYLGEFLNRFAEAEPLEFVDESTYPFLHKELKRDVLSPFFETREKAPNIVFITVEGLGRAFSNRGAYLGSFTPFLDSLSTKSLYWPNFLSNGGRTFAVLPSILGSLPFAETGFMEMQQDMPRQMSMFNLLKQNGYQTSFYHGGNSTFDKMAVFLDRNKVDRVIDEDDFPANYQKIPASTTGFTWGYGDKELFRFYLDRKSKELEKPSLDFLLTISMHNPFIIDEPEKYIEKFESRMTDFGFDESKKEQYRNYTDQYTSILYTDDAIKKLFESYRQREDFKNTIFIITGDHRIPEIPMASKIDRYHVPLIIYSPLLKRTGEFESISSHFDVAPSLLSFLKNNYQIRLPEVNSFVGRGLDTTRSFQNIHNIPLKQTKTNLVDFVMDEYHLNGNELFRLNREMRAEPVNDEAKKEELKNAFNQFKRKNAAIIEGKKIIPDSVFAKYLNL